MRVYEAIGDTIPENIIEAMMLEDIWRKLMPRGPSKTLSVIVSVETQERLEKLANSKRWSVSQTARILIEEGLDQHEAEDKKND